MTLPHPVRRLVLKSALSGLWAGTSWAHGRSADTDYVHRLRSGGVVVLIRHSETEPGIGDPPGMRLEDCASQRNLSQEGRVQAQRIGKWFSRHGLAPLAVRSSAWCRCLDTAREAFGPSAFGRSLAVESWPALNSFFQGHGQRERQLREAASRARMISTQSAAGYFEVWVTHQVVITALTGRHCAMGEMIVAASSPESMTASKSASGVASGAASGAASSPLVALAFGLVA